MIRALGNLIASIFDSRIGFDKTLKVIDLEELNQKGYINLPDSDFPVNPDYEKKAQEHVTGAFIRKLRGWDPIISPIHPIFLPRKWNNVSTDDYDLMIPALKLASRILDEPQILTYIKGALKKPLTPINDQEAVNKAGQPLYTFSNEPLRDWTSEEIWHTVSTLRDCIEFHFSAHLPFGCMAMCGPGDTGSMIAIGAYSARITLNNQFLGVFRRKLKASQFSKPWKPGTHDESAVLRSQFAFAVTLVHEVMHALWLTSNPTYVQHYASPEPPAWVMPKEPFYRDGRMNELGACWETHVFGGNIHMLGHPHGAIMPYGLTTVPFPGTWDFYPSVINRGNPRKWGYEWTTTYPIEMKHIRKMFTNEMWDEVQRYGIKRLRRKRKLGYRTYTDRKFSELAPGEASLGQALSPTSSVDSKEREEDHKGVVRREPPTATEDNSFVIIG
ncbi:hypothetical protein KCU77_g12029, partial [Aureobasidium melanogenum]